MIRVYKTSETDPLLRVMIEAPDERGSEEIVFANKAATKRYRLRISSTGLSLALVSRTGGAAWGARDKAA
jgi:hypothetical protein